jgi:hypothetical protein
MARKPKHIAEFGDFQTPDGLANSVLSCLRSIGIKPAAIVEPSCGKGAFLVASAKAFPTAKLFGLEINPSHLAVAESRLGRKKSVYLKCGSFFAEDWSTTIGELPRPLLVVGNPPWVTNAELGQLGSGNLPTKSNFQKFKGLDAVTGKSNFDISEWMLIKNLEWIIEAKGVLAVLCKIAVARKVLNRAWQSGVPITEARIIRIDAKAHFNAAVDACLCIIRTDQKSTQQSCKIYETFDAKQPISTLGFADNTIVTDLEAYTKTSWLRGADPKHTWRSGLKHDCSKVMELTRVDASKWLNGFDEAVSIEPSHLYPLMKSSDIAGSRTRIFEKWVIVPQRAVGEPTHELQKVAPRTWNYLLRHAAALDARTSIIYKKKPRFAIFGVGPYTFAPWKVAISGLYKKLEFKLYGPTHGRPTIFDDTVYFLPFESEVQATEVLKALQGKAAQAFLSSMVFWDEKRPITVELLKRLDLTRLLVPPSNATTPVAVISHESRR